MFFFRTVIYWYMVVLCALLASIIPNTNACGPFCSRSCEKNVLANKMVTIKEFRAFDGKHNASKQFQDDKFLCQELVLAEDNFEKAKMRIDSHLEWRAAGNIDNILKENWDEMRILFPYSMNTFTINGFPVLYINFARWDISAYLSENSKEKLERYFVMIIEESEALLKQLQEEGIEVFYAFLLINMGDYSLAKHGCYQCLLFYRNLALTVYAQYPITFRKIVMINVPFIFKLAYNIIGDMQPTIMFGQDQEVWQAELLKYIDRSQFPDGLWNEKLIAQDNQDGLIKWNEEL